MWARSRLESSAFVKSGSSAINRGQGRCAPHTTSIHNYILLGNRIGRTKESIDYGILSLTLRHKVQLWHRLLTHGLPMI